MGFEFDNDTLLTFEVQISLWRSGQGQGQPTTKCFTDRLFYYCVSVCLSVRAHEFGGWI